MDGVDDVNGRAEIARTIYGLAKRREEIKKSTNG